jgi:hypothetical protein
MKSNGEMLPRSGCCQLQQGFEAADLVIGKLHEWAASQPHRSSIGPHHQERIGPNTATDTMRGAAASSGCPLTVASI